VSPAVTPMSMTLVMLDFSYSLPVANSLPVSSTDTTSGRPKVLQGQGADNRAARKATPVARVPAANGLQTAEVRGIAPA
jgi:hypothetical protein